MSSFTNLVKQVPWVSIFLAALVSAYFSFLYAQELAAPPRISFYQEENTEIKQGDGSALITNSLEDIVFTNTGDKVAEEVQIALVPSPAGLRINSAVTVLSDGGVQNPRVERVDNGFIYKADFMNPETEVSIRLISPTEFKVTVTNLTKGLVLGQREYGATRTMLHLVMYGFIAVLIGVVCLLVYLAWTSRKSLIEGRLALDDQKKLNSAIYEQVDEIKARTSSLDEMRASCEKTLGDLESLVEEKRKATLPPEKED